MPGELTVLFEKVNPPGFIYSGKLVEIIVKPVG